MREIALQSSRASIFFHNSFGTIGCPYEKKLNQTECNVIHKKSILYGLKTDVQDETKN